MEETMMIPADLPEELSGEGSGEHTPEEEYQPTSDDHGQATQPDAETAATREEDAVPSQEGEDTYWPVYNGEKHPIRMSQREEITTLLQLGMKQRDILPQYERLTRLAAVSGDASVKALIDRLCETQETESLQAAIAAYGEKEGRRFYEMERERHQRRYEALMAEQENRAVQKDDAMRLAEEFAQLQQHYPEMTDVRQLSPQVIATALEKRISLLDAQNRFVISEQKRQKRAEAEAAEAAKATTGTLAHGADTPPSAMDAFLAGLHSRA